MIKVSKIVLLAVTLLGFGQLMASGTSSTGAIGSIAVAATGNIKIYPESGTWGNPDSCAYDQAVILDPTNSHFDKIYAMLLAASTSGTDVSFFLDGCVSQNGNMYPKVTSVTSYN